MQFFWTAAAVLLVVLLVCMGIAAFCCILCMGIAAFCCIRLSAKQNRRQNDAEQLEFLRKYREGGQNGRKTV